MEDGLPSVSVGGVGSRFISQNDLEEAKARREDQWKAAYARLGQVPPPQPVEDSFDGRSLAEKLAANRAAKQEEWEEKTKLANQFRALEEDEIMFLDSIREKQAEEERLRKAQDGEELSDFRKAVAARENDLNKPSQPIAQPRKQSDDTPEKPKAATVLASKKDVKKSLKGVVVKKRPKSNIQTPSESKAKAKESAKSIDDDAPPVAKRRKISGS
ncbi:N-terminal domain of NEFA-interacting nuclear protein NIP30-domain-containing protein [Suillus clintonianus]|uniref:N-terminal domain of NEFA-interacting nuclear protein NIP30-domain-containing protein n=1 Tax=Suillus clintonianus TaxID=1904413 RepID=UPI001B884C0F|nr:N-terminal domain of NEFA-interacting nuclear protein NIP30-domain-containing protein [Suillus clintonianus]KAG2129881.1 N-terminal domain of NEFA-interacting nuclear protein NIP30-domain-containing protein [Suillus clintonianus]